MSFGLAGAHGTGKSTIAGIIHRDGGLPYYDGSSGRIMKALGYDSVSKMPIAQRIEAQYAYLGRYLEEIDKMERPFITDRTPLDMIAYMLAETNMHGDPSLAPAITTYVERCLEATCNLFDTIVFVTPFGPVPARDGKPQVDAAYQAHIQFLIEGTLSSINKRLGCHIVLRNPDLQARVDIVAKVINIRIDHMEKAVSEAVLH